MSPIYKRLKGIFAYAMNGHPKFVALLTKEKGKTAMNEWERDD